MHFPQLMSFPTGIMTALKNLSSDTNMQNFWTEAINKEANVRFEWQLRYSKEFSKTAFKPQPPKRKTLQLNEDLTQRIKELESSVSNNVPTSLEGSGDKTESLQSSPLVDMNPASKDVLGLLYDGLSHHGEGRYSYLRKRVELSPDKKYSFPLVSSMNYGWKILDFVSLKPSCYGRTAIVKNTFYRSSGIILA